MLHIFTDKSAPLGHAGKRIIVAAKGRDEDMNVGERIRGYRTAMGLSQEELAQRALVSRPTLSHWETGRTLPDAQSLLILSQIFGVSIDDLVLGDADEMRDMVRAEACASHGRTILLAGITAASACALVTVGLTARPMVGSVAQVCLGAMCATMFITLTMRGLSRAAAAQSAAGVLRALDKNGRRSSDPLDECLADQIARDGAKDPFSALVLSLATAVAVASAMVWAATLIAPSLFIS